MTENILLLSPEDPLLAPASPEQLEERLRTIGFVGEAFEHEGQRHLKPGPEFMTQLIFLGCSPVVSLGEPGKTGDEFAHIRIDAALPEPVCLTADNVKVPRCRCGYRLEQWPDEVAAWQQSAADYRFRCPECGRETALHKLNWKQCAAFGRLFIRVWGIFEGEAVPGDELLRALSEFGGEWRGAYLRYSDRR